LHYPPSVCLPTRHLRAAAFAVLTAARLYHADPSITLRVHAHVISNQLAETADIFDRVMKPGG
jgi:integrase